MDTQVEDIKHKLDIVDVISSYLPLKKRGRHFLANCPFHQEKTPSFTVSPELQIFKCFGCGKAGDIFTFVQEYERIDFRDALEQLAKRAGVTLVRSFQSTQQESYRKTLINLNHQVARFYHYVLTSHPLGATALQYVLDRGIKLTTIKEFQIGFSPPNSQLIINYLLKKNFSLPDLIASGTFGQSQYGSRRHYDRFQGRLTFPLFDYRGQILGFSGRILPGAKAELAKYINSPETEIYHKSHMLYGLHLAKESIRKTNRVLVVEGEFDMISPYQAGVTNTVAIKGTAFTSDQLQLLKRYTDTLILGLDSDFAGNNAAKKSIELAENLEFDIQVLDLGEKFKDPDEAIRSDPEFFHQQLDHPLPIYDFLIRSAVKNYGTDTIRGKKQILSLVLPFLVKITNSVIRSDYYRQLTAQLGSDLESIRAEAAKYSAVNTTHNSPRQTGLPGRSPAITGDNALEKMEESLLTLIFGSKKPSALAKKLQKRLEPINTPRFRHLLDILLTTEKFNPLSFQETLPSELQDTYNQLYLSATSQNIESLRRQREIKKLLDYINIYHTKTELKQVSLQIAQSSSPELETKYNQLLTQLSRLQPAKS